MQGFEQRVERMVEGVFARAFKSQLKPVELGRRLVRAMDAGRNLDVQGRAIVPNAYRFSLSAADHAAFTEILGPLTRELVEAAREHARQEGYGFMGPVVVELVEGSGALKPGRFELAAQMRERAAASATVRPLPTAPAAPAPSAPAAVVPTFNPVPAPAVAPIPVAIPPAVAPVIPAVFPSIAAPAAPAAKAPAVPSAPGTRADDEPLAWADGDSWIPTAPGYVPTTATLLLATGERLELTGTTVIGRLMECNLVVNDPNVSRQHCELRPEPGGWLLVDLGSTNGTRVNGSVTPEARLADGDVITVGATRIRFEVR